MFILCILSLIIAEKVKIFSRDSPGYVLTMIKNAKGGSIRMMQEDEVENPTELSVFEINGDKTEIVNNGITLCGNIWSSGISTCERDFSKKTVFNVIKTNTDVTFRTDSGKCLAMEEYDSDTKGYYLKLNSCDDSPSQKFKLVDMSTPEQPKTPPASFSNEANSNSQNSVNDACSNMNMSKATSSAMANTSDINSQNNVNDACSNMNMSKATSSAMANASDTNSQNDACSNMNMSKAASSTMANASDSNSQSNVNDACSKVNIPEKQSASIQTKGNSNSQNNAAVASSNMIMPNIVFIPVTLESSNIPLLTKDSPFSNNINPSCLNANRITAPTTFKNVETFRRPAQPVNGCDSHIQWTNAFRRIY